MFFFKKTIHLIRVNPFLKSHFINTGTILNECYLLSNRGHQQSEPDIVDLIWETSPWHFCCISAPFLSSAEQLQISLHLDEVFKLLRH